MMVNHNERITVQHVSDFADVQEKMNVWLSRVVHNGFNVESSTTNHVVVKKRSTQGYLVAVFGPVIGFFYGSFMYGSSAGVIYALIFGVLGLLGIPLVKPTVVTTTWNNEPTYYVNVEATGYKRDFKKVIEDLKYILTTDPGTSLQ